MTVWFGIQRLGDSLVQLEEVLSSLEQSIKDIIKDVEGKKKVHNDWWFLHVFYGVNTFIAAVLIMYNALA